MKILVGLIEHLGDIVACEPVARYLKTENIECSISWAVIDRYRELIDQNPYVDNVIVVECLTDWIKLSKHESFDRIVDLHVNYRVCDHCRIPLVKTVGNPFVSVYEWFDYGALLEAFSQGAGLPKLSYHPNVYIADSHIQAVNRLNLPPDFCVFHRVSNNVQKDWTDEGWRQLSDYVTTELGLTIVDVGAGKPTQAGILPDGSVNLFNQISILETAEVIRRSRFFVGVDSGPSHLANATKTAGVVLLGRHGYFRTYTPYTGYYASADVGVKIVRNLVGDVRDIAPDEVKEAVRYIASVTELRNERNFETRSEETGRKHETGSNLQYRDLLSRTSLFDPVWYSERYPEVAQTGLSPLDHFLANGLGEKRSPGPNFDTDWYLGRYPDVAELGMNPLVHYLLFGLRQGRLPAAQGGNFGLQDNYRFRDVILQSGYFDPVWYVMRYPEVAQTGLPALDHFLAHGHVERKSPGPNFDTSWYMDRNPDVLASGMIALAHFALYGFNEGRLPAPPKNVTEEGLERRLAERAAGWASATGGAVTFTQFHQHDLSQATNNGPHFPETFAFYLPQFHPNAENDFAHCPGFSEWHNVIKAKKQFRSHYQPRVPGELGFYDLRTPGVLDLQASLAKRHGIDGFCFYYYYFQGKKLLFNPIENFIKSSIDMPFMLFWANENWSKRWDGGDNEVIIAQTHAPEDDIFFIRQLRSVFEDRRYKKVNGKPVLIVYKPHLLEASLESTERWRREIEAMGFPGIYLIMADDWQGEINHPRDYGFDASYEIPTNIVPEGVIYSEQKELDVAPDFTGRIVDYKKFASFHLSRQFPAYKRFRTVMLPWDNTARYGSRALIHVNGDGEDYRLWLMQALLDSYQRYEAQERMVFLHSWNEWCEGTYLEPDGKRGCHFLEQTKEAIEISRRTIEWSSSSADVPLAAELFRIATAKNDGVHRLVNAARHSTAHVWTEMASKNEALHHKNALIQELTGRATAQGKMIEELTDRIDNLNSQVTNLNDRLRQKGRVKNLFRKAE